MVAELHLANTPHEHYRHPVEDDEGRVYCAKCPPAEEAMREELAKKLDSDEHWKSPPKHPLSLVNSTRLAQVRTFPSGATRDLDNDKLDPEGFLSPLVLQRFAEYMHKHRMQADGSVRESDNWQKGMPLTSYMKSGWRHFMEWWRWHRGIPLKPAKPRDPQDIEEVLCAMLFNVQAYLHELLKKEQTEIRKAA